MWNVHVCVINRLIFESACRKTDWIFFLRQESGCFDLSVPRLRFLTHSRIKVPTRVHQPKSRRWRWRRKAEKQNRICMHRSVPEYKQRIIRGHKVTVSCYIAWRRVRVRGARGMKVWIGWREQDETLFPPHPDTCKFWRLFCWHLKVLQVPSSCSNSRPVVASFSLFVGGLHRRQNGTRTSQHHYYVIPIPQRTACK